MFFFIFLSFLQKRAGRALVIRLGGFHNFRHFQQLINVQRSTSNFERPIRSRLQRGLFNLKQFFFPHSTFNVERSMFDVHLYHFRHFCPSHLESEAMLLFPTGLYNAVRILLLVYGAGYASPVFVDLPIQTRSRILAFDIKRQVTSLYPLRFMHSSINSCS